MIYQGKNELSPPKGFTLVELLVVIAIIAILAAVIVLIINPLELTKRSRDATRLSDLNNLQQAINIALQESPNANPPVICAMGISGGFCKGDSVNGNGASGPNTNRNIDGQGWLPINFTQIKTIQVPTLPLDPTNTTGPTGYHYSYCSDGVNYELDAKLESKQQQNRAANDAGDQNDIDGGTALYEVGTKLNLINPFVSCNY